MKKTLLILSLLFIVCISNAQVKVDIDQYSKTVNGDITLEYPATVDGKIVMVTFYADINDDSICFTQLRKKEGEQEYYYLSQDIAAIRDIDLGPKHVWETNLVGKDILYYYIDIDAWPRKTFNNLIIEKKQTIIIKETDEFGIYCFTKKLAEDTYNNIKAKQNLK